VAVAVDEGRFRGEPALILTSGSLVATFLPALGMTGVSLRYQGQEHLAVPGGLAALRAGRTLGLPLLAPWANRLGSWRYRAAGVSVDLTGMAISTDARGLPIHGLLVGQPGWRVTRPTVRRDAARVVAALNVDAPAFPFPHRLELTIRVRPSTLQVATTVHPTGSRSVPVAFGWHPYLRLPSASRRSWRLTLPVREHLALDDRGIPTGVARAETAEAEPIGSRHFDDLYALGRNGRLALTAPDGAAVEMRAGANYPFAQVWVPPNRPFAALEPMAAPTNALVDGRAPLVEPGESLTASFALSLAAGA
jgi:galactose mutarotase-like enzyme